MKKARKSSKVAKKKSPDTPRAKGLAKRKLKLMRHSATGTKRPSYKYANVSLLEAPTIAVRVVKKPSTIPKEQWELPISVNNNGKFVTLSEYSSMPDRVSTLESLSGRQIKDLVITRIKMQNAYPTRFMLGVGEVNKAKALEEIEANSPAGKFILESEQRVIKMMKTEIEKTETAHESSLH